jgi:5-formyltetrahydrofolate cyclo-ligase
VANFFREHSSMQACLDIRREMRTKRRKLTSSQQRIHAASTGKILKKSLLFRANHIACYLANDGELNLQPFITECFRANKKIYLPSLQTNSKKLRFKQYQLSSKMKMNQYGIPEPANAKCRPTWALDLILLPLVSFDLNGNRLGMGGGYYDRTFNFTQNNLSDKPWIVGIGHECQQHENLPKANWDIPLQYLATEKKLYQFHHESVTPQD